MVGVTMLAQVTSLRLQKQIGTRLMGGVTMLTQDILQLRLQKQIRYSPLLLLQE